MFKDEIKKFREENNLTQEALAHLMGVSWHTIHRLETGKNQPSPMAKKIFEQLKERFIHPHER